MEVLLEYERKSFGGLNFGRKVRNQFFNLLTGLGFNFVEFCVLSNDDRLLIYTLGVLE